MTHTPEPTGPPTSSDTETPTGAARPAPGSIPNPAGPEGRRPRPDPEPLSRPSRHLVRIADRMPDWAGSIRFRLTVLYTLFLFGLAAFMVAGLYAVLSARLNDESQLITRTREVTVIREVPGGIALEPTEVRAQYQSVEQLANERALALLRTYSTTALGLLLAASLVVGWVVAGRVLAPIGRITAVARDIQATDLERRIDLRGPPDELKELADTFDAMLARLDEAFASQQRFIQEASHELRNPLAVIRTNLDVALSDPDPNPDDLRQTAEVVARTADRMSTLVDDLLVYARLGAPERDLGLVDLHDIATEAEEEFRAPAATRDLRLRVDSRPGHAVYGDRIALRRAVANLLTNAIRHAPTNSEITVTVHRIGDLEQLAVADAGPGIDEADRPHVFDRFWRGERAAARRTGRSGLGLAIVDQILTEHDGAATLRPNEAGGSTFVLTLPAADARPDLTAAEP